MKAILAKRNDEKKASQAPGVVHPETTRSPQNDGGVPAGMPKFLRPAVPCAYATPRPPLQTKLTINQPGDVYEQEADRVADTVMRMPDAHPDPTDATPATSDPIQRLCTECDEENDQETSEAMIQTALRDSPASFFQRKCTNCEEDDEEAAGVSQYGETPTVQNKTRSGSTRNLVHAVALQTKPESSTRETRASSVRSVISSPGAGAPLSDNVRNQVEPALGADLSDVRVHSDAQSQSAAADINAKAFTHQNHIYMGAGQSGSDLDLMAHEATHVVQQRGGSPATLLQRNEDDHSDETYNEFTERVKTLAATRLTRNIGVLAQWSRYIQRMEDFQLQAQLLAGVAREYAVTAMAAPHLQKTYETWAGTHNEDERAYSGSLLDIDSTYRERSNNYLGFIESRAFGHFTSPSVAERSQVLVGDTRASELPMPEWVPADHRYSAYVGPIQRFRSGESGGCQTCHDLNAARAATIKRWGSAMPEGPMFPDFENFTSLLGENDLKTLTPGALSPDEVALIESWINSPSTVGAEQPQVASNTGVVNEPTSEPTSAPTANRFIPQIPVPEPVEVPPPRTDLCGDLSPAEKGAGSQQFDPAAWGPNSAIMFDVISRIGAILTPLGPRGYRVLGSPTFDELWAVGPGGSDLEDVRGGIIAKIAEKRENYADLRSRIRAGSVPYLDLCPAVDELLPSTSPQVRAIVLHEIHTQRAIEAIVEAADWILLALAFIYPPSIIATVPLRVGLGLAKIGIGAEQARRGADIERGAGAGVFSSAQEASAESLQSRGRMNMLAGALDLMFLGVGRLTAQKPPSVFEDELLLRGWRRSSTAAGTMWHHPEYTGTIWRQGNVFEFADGSMNTIGRLEFVGRNVRFNTVGFGSAAPGSAAGGFGGAGTAMVPYGGTSLVTTIPYTTTLPPTGPLFPGPVPGGSLVSAGTELTTLEGRLVQSGQFEGRSGLVGEPFLPRLPGETPLDHRERMLDAIEGRFDEALYDEYRLAITEGRVAPGEDWDGFQFNRQDPLGTRFDPENRMIVFTLDRSLNRFSVAEEVQHALDYTLGAQSTREMSERGMQALAERTGRSLEQVRANLTNSEVDWINDWWHRRVFTRLIKNIHAGNYGLDYLQSRIDEVHELYQEVGGELTLEELLSRSWEGVY